MFVKFYWGQSAGSDKFALQKAREVEETGTLKLRVDGQVMPSSAC